MKVATDACILGAVTPAFADGAILDIGTGTGLLSLMMAQKCSSRIDAVELDEASFLQATANVQNSLWKDRINVINTDVRTFHHRGKYNLIICNPPFYEKHFKSPYLKKNKAKHAEQLSYQELIDVIKRSLNAHGMFSVLLPANSSERFIKQASLSELYVNERILIRENEQQEVIRHIIFFSNNATDQQTEKILVIKNGDGTYSKSFIELMQPYYLQL